MMKIIISPSKTQNPTKSAFLHDLDLLYPEKHLKILSILKKMSKENIKKTMKITGKMFEQTYDDIQHYEDSEEFHSFEGFNGLVFKGLDKASYKELEYEYISKYVRILDAFYGVLEPGTLIKKYRFDMKMNIGINLNEFWNISTYFKSEVIINLASYEFSKMLKSNNIINIVFLQQIKNEYINQATYTKQARGIFLNYLIKEKIIEIEKMKDFTELKYKFNQMLSDQFNLVFTRIA